MFLRQAIRYATPSILQRDMRWHPVIGVPLRDDFDISSGRWRLEAGGWSR